MLLSSETREAVHADGVTVRDLGPHRLKDLPHPERLFQLLVEALPNDFPPVRQHDPAPIAAGLPDYSLPPADVVCPYKGLAASEADDADLFCGREPLVAEILERLASPGLLAIVGPSGSGKSSLVRAGAVPALRAARSDVAAAVLVPGEHPLSALEAAQADAGRRAAARRRPVRGDLHALSLAGRARAAPRPAVRRGLRRGRHRGRGAARGPLRSLRLPSATRRGDPGPPAPRRSHERGELRRAIEGPARAVGLTLEPGSCRRSCTTCAASRARCLCSRTGCSRSTGQAAATRSRTGRATSGSGTWRPAARSDRRCAGMRSPSPRTAGGRSLAAGSAFGAVRVGDGRSGRPRGPARRVHADEVAALAHDAHGRLVTAGRDGAALIWPGAGGDGVIRVFAERGGSALTVSRRGDLAAIGRSDATVRVRRLADGATTLVLDGAYPAFLPDGRRLVTLGEDPTTHSVSEGGPLEIRDVARGGRLTARVAAHGEGLEAMLVSPDGRHVANWERLLVLTSLPPAAPRQVGQLAQRAAVAGAAFSPDSRRLATVGHDGAVRFWDVPGRRPLGAQTLAAGAVHANAVAFTPDGRTLAVGGQDGTVRLIDTERRAPRGTALTTGEAVRGLDVHPDGEVIAVVGRTRLTSWRLDRREMLGDPVAVGRDLVAGREGLLRLRGGRARGAPW